jgi:exopolyphosphatase/guanosine-5'-triphosphate,3'-diphosphate pyrophosphatase
MQSKSSRIAVIDIGTNTCILLIAELMDGKLIKIFEQTEFPRIGESVDEKKIISNSSLQRLGKVLKEYLRFSHTYEADRVFAFATSALRDAKNKNEIISSFKKKLDLQINIFDGFTEAKFGYFGAVFDFKDGNSEHYTVLDIGGGSTENSYIDEGKFFSKSIDIGSVRMTEKFFKNGINDKSIGLAKNFIGEKFLEINFLNLEHRALIGVAGTLTTLSALNQNLKIFDEEKVHKNVLAVNDIDILFNRLTRMNEQQILELGDYMRGRADIITAGALILLEFMNYFGFEEITVSSKGLRYGVFLYLTKN